MRGLLHLAIATSLLVSSAPAASKKHKSKHKDKSFEPVTSAEAGGYAGHYVGIESRNWVEVKLDPENRLEVTLYEDGARVSLRDVELTGCRLEATKVFGDSAADFEATFGERRVNGEGAFGLLVETIVRFDDDVVLERLFYRRQAPSRGSAP
jgi:hypothetical protein